MSRQKAKNETQHLYTRDIYLIINALHWFSKLLKTTACNYLKINKMKNSQKSVFQAIDFQHITESVLEKFEGLKFGLSHSLYVILHQEKSQTINHNNIQHLYTMKTFRLFLALLIAISSCSCEYDPEMTTIIDYAEQWYHGTLIKSDDTTPYEDAYVMLLKNGYTDKYELTIHMDRGTGYEMLHIDGVECRTDAEGKHFEASNVVGTDPNGKKSSITSLSGNIVELRLLLTIAVDDAVWEFDGIKVTHKLM